MQTSWLCTFACIIINAMKAKKVPSVYESCSAAAWAHHSSLATSLLSPTPPPHPTKPSSCSPLHKLMQQPSSLSSEQALWTDAQRTCHQKWNNGEDKKKALESRRRLRFSELSQSSDHKEHSAGKSRFSLLAFIIHTVSKINASVDIQKRDDWAF